MKNSYLKTIFVSVFIAVTFSSRAQTINTIAGTGFGGYSGDGGQATDAELSFPAGIAMDASGDLFIADFGNTRIREINSSGIISTLAGNGSPGFSGDGGPATAAEFTNTTGVAADISGNIYFSDETNNRIRIVNSSGIINTFAGINSAGYSGDGGPATAAELFYPSGVTTDALGNVYIIDRENQCIRIVNTSGIINSIAGLPSYGAGYSGDGGPATAAEINDPYGMAVDISGNIYIADGSNNRIRIVNTSGIINTLAGIGFAGYSGDAGQATAAEINAPNGVYVDASGNVYIGDSQNNRIRIVNTSGIINTIAGNGAGSYSGDGGPATAAEIDYPYGVAVDPSGNIYLADYSNNRIRYITSITTGTDNIASHNEVITYPSPTSGKFNVGAATKGQVIELYNYSGQKLSSSISDNSIMHFDISNYADGIYFVRILNTDGTIVTTKKVLKTE
jgi:trimeric autotransporter adhesin